MLSAADARNDDDDAPPESGIRRRVPPTATLARSPRATPDTESRSNDALAAITVEACLETWALTRRLMPLQGAWFLPSATQLGAALLTLLGAPRDTAPQRSWAEYLPGYAAMDTLANLLVDAVCAG
jgi:hypothetical protein